MDYSKKLDELLLTTARQNASDLHLAVGSYQTLRIDGALIPLAKESVLNPEAVEGLVSALLTPEQKEKFLKEKEIDFTYAFEDKARFRANVYYQRGFKINFFFFKKFFFLFW